MIERILKALRKYGDRNEAAYRRINVRTANPLEDGKFGIPEIPPELERELRSDDIDELYVLEILNDDLTPVELVAELVITYCLQPYEMAYEIAFNIHRTGRSQAATGSKDALETVAGLIEGFARESKYPLKCKVTKV